MVKTSRLLWRRYVKGSPLERPPRRFVDFIRRAPWEVKKNRLEHWALCDLISKLPADANCVDVGANEGDILQAMVRGCPQGRHIAFEPVPELQEMLRRRFPAVEVRGEAVGDASGEAVFTLVPDRASRSGLAETIDLTVPDATVDIAVPVMRLDDVLPSEYVPTLVKIDVEGAELQVIQGARTTLRAHRPVLAFEHQYGNRIDRQKTLALYAELADAGYTVRTMSGLALTADEFADRVAARTEWNFLAYPDARDPVSSE